MRERSDRRSFLESAFWAFSSIYAALLGIPTLRYILHPLRHRTMTEPEEFIRIGRVADFPLNRPVRVTILADMRDAWNRLDKVRRGSVWVVRRGARDLRILSTICPHLGCGIVWEGEKARFSCPCHDSRFRRDGTRTAGPSPRDMDPLEVRIEGKDVFVKYVRFETGTKERRVVS